ncbi:MAG: transposase [Deltaproteobacteria bacterium]|nr:transposase [Deltaproteobacteria bacterium]
MARPLRIVYPGAFYHVTSRGNEQKKIFLTDGDRKQFLSYLKSATERYRASIHCYCLMQNHYHLLLETAEGNLPEIMHHINGAYTTYFNIKHQRAGHLFQGRYKAVLVDADEYAQELSRYIHLNPVRAGAAARPEAYAWSSYQDYIGMRPSPEWLRRDFILGFYAGTIDAKIDRYRKFVGESTGQATRSPFTNVKYSAILGNSSFIKTVKEKHIGDRNPGRNVPALRELASRPSIMEIEKETSLAFEDDPVLKKQASIYLCRKYTGKTLKEIGVHFGISESGVSQAGRRTDLRINADRMLKNKMSDIERRLGLSRV